MSGLDLYRRPDASWPQVQAGRCPPPLHGTPRTPARRTLGHRIARLAPLFGWRLMPWQRLVVDVVLELRPDGRFVYSTVILIVPRQNAKSTTLFLLTMNALLLVAFGKGVYSAQTGEASRNKVGDDWIPLLDPKSEKAMPFSQLVRKAPRGVGSTGVELLNGSKLIITSSAESAGHGGTNDVVVLDEAWSDKGSSAREVALGPTTLVPPMAQTYIASIAGDWESTWLEDKAKLGRQIVAGDDATRGPIAFFEWAAPADEERWRSMRVAALSNPGYGRTILPHKLRAEQTRMGELDYRRQNLGQWTEGDDEGGVTTEMWRRVAVPEVRLAGYVALGIDAGGTGEEGVVVAVDEAGSVRLLQAEPGTSWIFDYVVEMAARIRAETGRRVYVAARAGGTLRETAKDLRRGGRLGRGVSLVETADYQGYCTSLWERLSVGDLSVEDNGRLRALVLGCTRRTTGDRTWSWSPRSVDLTVAGVAALTLGFGELQGRARARTRYYSPDEEKAADTADTADTADAAAGAA